MSTTLHSIQFTLEPSDNHRLLILGGRFDEHFRHIENILHIEIHNRGNHFTLLGTKKNVLKAKDALETVYELTKTTSELSPETILFYLQGSNTKAITKNPPIKNSTHENDIQPSIEIGHKRIRPRTENQVRYINNILKNDINFGIGPAGTGKTYLAVACALSALKANEVERIILVRPVVEAGEHLGFLPGDLSQKIDPYLRPLFDALYEMLGLDQVVNLIERNVIELAPLAYMRGRTLNDAFVLLDEGQNTTREQMKMFLTRLGFNSKAIITGDITQIDLHKSHPSGLNQAIHILQNIPGIQFTYFGSTDVVRHPLIQHIVEAYQTYDEHVTPPKK